MRSSIGPSNCSIRPARDHPRTSRFAACWPRRWPATPSFSATGKATRVARRLGSGLALAAGTDVLEFRLGRAATLCALRADYRAALAEAAAADRSIDDRGSLRVTSALVHAVLSAAIRRDPSLAQDVRARGRRANRGGSRTDRPRQALTGLSRCPTVVSPTRRPRLRPPREHPAFQRS